jgi:hypothetical protein
MSPVHSVTHVPGLYKITPPSPDPFPTLKMGKGRLHPTMDGLPVALLGPIEDGAPPPESDGLLGFGCDRILT